MDEETKNLNEENNQDKFERKESINETQESVTASKMGRIQNSETREEAPKQDSPDKNIIFEELKKYLTSPDHKKSQKLIANMKQNLGSMVSKMCNDKSLSERKSGEEPLIAQEFMANLTAAGFMKAFADKIKNGEKANEGLGPESIIKSNDPEIDDDLFQVAVNPSLNYELVKEQNVALFLNGNTIEGVNADTDSLKAIVEKFLFAVIELVNDEFDVKTPHIPKMPKNISDKIKKTFGEAVKSQIEEVLPTLEEAPDDKNLMEDGFEPRAASETPNDKNLMEDGLEPELVDETPNGRNSLEDDLGPEVVDETISEIPVMDNDDVTPDFSHNKALEEALKDFDEYAERNGLSPENASKEAVKRVSDDALDKTKAKLQEEADRNHIMRNEPSEHNDRNDKGQR